MRHEPERWAADYKRDGYLVVEDCLDPDTLRTLQDKVGGILADPDGVPAGLRHHVQKERSYLERQPDAGGGLGTRGRRERRPAGDGAAVVRSLSGALHRL